MIARETLLKARDPEYFGYDESAFEGYVTQLVSIFSLAREKPRVDSTPVMVVPGCGESLERRCGRVFDNAYKNDRKHLFLPQLYDLNLGNGSGVSSFAVRASVYFAFFGRHFPSSNTQTVPAMKPTNPPPSHATENRPPDGPEAIREPPSRDQAPQGAACLQATVPVPSGGQEAPSMETSNQGSNLPVVTSRDESSEVASTSLPTETTDLEMMVSNKTLSDIVRV